MKMNILFKTTFIILLAMNLMACTMNNKSNVIENKNEIIEVSDKNKIEGVEIEINNIIPATSPYSGNPAMIINYKVKNNSDRDIVYYNDFTDIVKLEGKLINPEIVLGEIPVNNNVFQNNIHEVIKPNEFKVIQKYYSLPSIDKKHKKYNSDVNIKITVTNLNGTNFITKIFNKNMESLIYN